MARWAHGMVFVMKPNPRLLTLGGFSNSDDLPPEVNFFLKISNAHKVSCWAVFL